MAGFNTAVTGLKSASTMLDVTGNNIANSSTTGFKSSRTEFSDIYASSVVGAGSSNIPGSGVTVADIAQDFSAGTIEFTNSNLDLAINGSGFFQLDDGNGTTSYTRAGAFELDKDGNIVSKNGKFLQGYGLDAQGNVLPVQNLAVSQKESAPKATENIALSFNIDSVEDSSLLSPTFDKNDPGSYTYSTTVETVDSLGNPNTIRFYMVEQAPVRQQFQYDLSNLLNPASVNAAGDFSVLTNFPNWDPLNGGTSTSFDITLTADDTTNPDTITASVGFDLYAARINTAVAAGEGDTLAGLLTEAINAAFPGSQDYVLVDYNTDGTFTTSIVDDSYVNSGATLSLGNYVGDTVGLAAVFGASGNTYSPEVEDLSVSSFVLDMNDLLNIGNGSAADFLSDPVRLADFEATDPRIDTSTLSYNPATGIFGFELFSEFTEAGDLVVEGANAQAGEVSLVAGYPQTRPTNAVQTLTLNEDNGFVTPASGGVVKELADNIEINIAGIDIQLTKGLNIREVGSVIAGFESAIIDRNPDIESVAFDSTTNEVTLTWKAEVERVDAIIVTSDADATAGLGAPFEADLVGEPVLDIVPADASFLGKYRLYGFLNNETALDLGKRQDPGEGLATEVGPIMFGFEPTTGNLNFVNGETVAVGADAPAIQIFGADPTNPNDLLLDNDTDSQRGIFLDITGSSQYASDSIVKAASQDGYPKGDLIGVSFAETGEMVASFSNGQRQNLGLVAIANFENQSGLQPAGSTEWIATLNSGSAIVNPPGTGLNGSLRSAALESSNVDLSAELVKLIEGQRNFQANSKTLETMNTVTQAILQI